MEGCKNMMVAIHQPHYFPWLGYLAKMASVDKFILMDTVQLEKGSYMIRNRIVDVDGNIRYLTISAEKHGFLEKEYRNIELKDVEIWTDRQKSALIRAYKKCDYFEEIWEAIFPIFEEKHELLCDVTIQSINILRDILQINTPLVLQSEIAIDNNLKKDKLILGLCKAAGADAYFAGRGGSMQYLNLEDCEKEGIHVIFQEFQHPIYTQVGNHPFVPGLSTLDVLFNTGIKKSREIFWNTIN